VVHYDFFKLLGLGAYHARLKRDERCAISRSPQ